MTTTDDRMVWHCSEHGEFQAADVRDHCPDCGKPMRFEYRQHSEPEQELREESLAN